MGDFEKRAIRDFKDYLEAVQEYRETNAGWVFRGQSRDLPPATTLERAVCDAGIELACAPSLEQELIRDFRRRYQEGDRQLVLDDTLYCLSLMQHHRAPTRLLDASYSIYVAVFFALETRNTQPKSPPVVWCVNGDWTGPMAAKLDRSCRLRPDRSDSHRTDTIFKTIYMPTGDRRSRFVHHENPMQLHERLIIQQGVFLCPADVSIPFMDNLGNMAEHDRGTNILKLEFPTDNDFRLQVLEDLQRMNINRATLFPGLDGFAESFKLRLPLLQRIIDRRKP